MEPFTFCLRAVTPGTPEACRVKRLLKELGRKHKLHVSWPAPVAHDHAVSPGGKRSRKVHDCQRD